MTKWIKVLMLPELAEPDADLGATCAIVIDVLRATTVMATAGSAGVRTIHTCESTEQTRALADRLSPRPLLCGERQCRPIAGFDLGNSPAEYDREAVHGREMILTTTNGTRAIKSVLSAKKLLTASFLNLGATADAASGEADVRVVCAGTNGQITYEDVLLAGALVDRLCSQGSFQLGNDSAGIALTSWREVLYGKQALRDALRQSLGGRNLIAAGYESDIERCTQIDSIDGIVIRTETDRAVFQYRSG